MQPIILHIDFDSFFASVEQQDNPQLRGKPIGVTAANSRSAIIAASIQAKQFGVKGGSNAREGYSLCPNLLLVPAHFPRYFEISKDFVKICRLYSPYLEVFSIDELFLDVTQTVHLFGGVDSLIAHMKQEIKNKIGEYITVSVGISHNKLLAKLASGLRKPNGQCAIRPEDVASIYAEIELTDICGIGSRIAKRLNMLGVYRLLQLRSLTFDQLKAEFGPAEAHFLENVAWARDHTPVVHFGNSPQVKSVGRNYALPVNEYNSRIVLQNIFELCEEIAIKLRRLKKKGRTIGISLRGSRNFHARETVLYYIDSGKELFEVCLKLLHNNKQEDPGKQEYVRQISIWISNLVDSNSVQHSLFDSTYRQDKLTQTIDMLNEKFGDHTIRNGFLLYSEKLTTVPNGFLADKWDRLQLTKLY